MDDRGGYAPTKPAPGGPPRGHTPPPRTQTPPRLEELPTVLDAEQARAVLRCGEKKLSELLSSGRLGRLGYSNTILIDSREIRRFLLQETRHGDG